MQTAFRITGTFLHSCWKYMSILLAPHLSIFGIVIFMYFNFTHSNRYIVVSHCGLYLNLMAMIIEDFFNILICKLYIFGCVYAQAFCSFYKLNCIFSYFLLWEVFTYSVYKSFVRYAVCSEYVAYIFIPLTVSSTEKKKIIAF